MSLDSAISNLVSRLETVASRLEKVEKQLADGGSPASSAPASGDDGSESPSVREYEDLISQFVVPLVDITSKLGASEVTEQVALFQQAVNAQRDMLKVAASSKKPSQDVITKLITPTSNIMAEIVKLRDAKRTSKFFNHLSTISEGVPALGWVLVSPTPAPHVGDMRAGSEFYSNRILKDFKGKEQIHVDWVSAINGFLKELQVYVKKNHTTGLTWNPKGGDASAFQPSSSSSSSGSVPPPPGPPPPPPADFSASSSSKSKAPDMGGVFAELNKGTDISKGLKKVTSDMKTKNRKPEEKSSVVPAKETKASGEPKSAKQQEPTKPPKFSLEGNKWQVENQVNNKEIVIADTEPKQSCYIYKCKGSTILIKGKINAITLDACTKTAVVFESVVASVEVVNCNSVEIQVTGKVPAIAIDKTSGIQLYLGADALETEIVSSKSDQMNVLIPGASADQDLVEMPIPEQYRTLIKGGKLITEPSSHV